jgi:polysaccharide export outer membrane protein
MAVLVLFLLSPFVPRVLNPLGNQPALAGEAKSQNDYLIGPGDVLEILVWQEEELSRTVRVRLDGKISLPLADEIQAAGKTPMQVKQLITKALNRFLDAPAVYVILEENRSKRFYMVGKVNAPGEYVIEKNTTLLQAISMASGFAEWADKGDIIVIRKGPKGQFRIRADYQRAVSGKDIEQNILLQPDDVIVVP